MALRVLLADESTTIKKVIQLALQDYAVQVRAVNVGVDALEVARSFEPDLILADVILPKKSGYDVCFEIKNDSDLRRTPVILMWSSFMELDEQLYAASKADDKLEKPFNVENLRALVQKWVPKTQEQKLSDYLHFPTTITEMEVEPTRLTDQNLEPTEALGGPPSIADAKELTQIDIDDEPTGEWDMDSFDDINNFVPTDHLIQKSTAGKLAATKAVGINLEETVVDAALDVTKPIELPEKTEIFIAKPSVSTETNINLFKLDTFEEQDEDAEDVDIQSLNQSPVNMQDLMTQREALRKAADEASRATTPKPEKNSPTDNEDLPAIPKIPELTQDQMETLLRAQSREVIEAVVWKIVPEMAGQIIRKELERLMAED